MLCQDRNHVVSAFPQPSVDDSEPLFLHPVRVFRIDRIGMCLIAQRHEQITVFHRCQQFQDHLPRHRHHRAFLQPVRIDAGDRNMTVAGTDQGFAQQLDIVRSPASAARLGNDQGCMIRIVFAALQRFQELTDNDQCRIAGIVVDIFQTQLCNFT